MFRPLYLAMVRLRELSFRPCNATFFGQRRSGSKTYFIRTCLGTSFSNRQLRITFEEMNSESTSLDSNSRDGKLHLLFDWSSCKTDCDPPSQMLTDQGIHGAAGKRLAEHIRVSPPKWLLQTFTNNRAYLVCKTNVLSDSSLRPLTELFINRLVDCKHLFTNFLWVWVPEIQRQLFRPRHDNCELY